MQLLKTQQELIALDLGMQAIALRGMQVQADEAIERIAELEARLAAVAAPAEESLASASHLQSFTNNG